MHIRQHCKREWASYVAAVWAHYSDVARRVCCNDTILTLQRDPQISGIRFADVPESSVYRYSLAGFCDLIGRAAFRSEQERLVLDHRRRLHTHDHWRSFFDADRNLKRLWTVTVRGNRDRVGVRR